jgi:hypothetical protein
MLLRYEIRVDAVIKQAKWHAGVSTTGESHYFLPTFEMHQQ